jgi:hypothetical protein
MSTLQFQGNALVWVAEINEKIAILQKQSKQFNALWNSLLPFFKKGMAGSGEAAPICHAIVSALQPMQHASESLLEVINRFSAEIQYK